MRAALLAIWAARAVIRAGSSRSSEQLCQGSAFLENQNWYCSPVHHITYHNVGIDGHYEDVVGMDLETGACNFAPRQFSGPLAPFNEPVRERWNA